jgi:hypothetical protein
MMHNERLGTRREQMESGPSFCVQEAQHPSRSAKAREHFGASIRGSPKGWRSGLITAAPTSATTPARVDPREGRVGGARCGSRGGDGRAARTIGTPRGNPPRARGLAPASGAAGRVQADLRSAMGDRASWPAGAGSGAARPRRWRANSGVCPVGSRPENSGRYTCCLPWNRENYPVGAREFLKNGHWTTPMPPRCCCQIVANCPKIQRIRG